AAPRPTMGGNESLWGRCNLPHTPLRKFYKQLSAHHNRDINAWFGHIAWPDRWGGGCGGGGGYCRGGWRCGVCGRGHCTTEINVIVEVVVGLQCVNRRLIVVAGQHDDSA